jgi:hypothetical protein
MIDYTSFLGSAGLHKTLLNKLQMSAGIKNCKKMANFVVRIDAAATSRW